MEEGWGGRAGRVLEAPLHCHCSPSALPDLPLLPDLPAEPTNPAGNDFLLIHQRFSGMSMLFSRLFVFSTLQLTGFQRVLAFSRSPVLNSGQFGPCCV